MVSKACVNAEYRKKITEMKNIGIDITLVVPEEWGGQKLEQHDKPNYRMIVKKAVMSGRNHFHFYPGIAAVIREERPDLLHIDEEAHSYVTFHTMSRAKGVMSIFFNWQNIYKDYPLPFSWFEKYSFNNSIGAIAGNGEVKEVLLKKGCRVPLAVIPQFGVDEKFFTSPTEAAKKSAREKYGLSGSFVIGYFGRFTEEKGIDTLLEAASLVKKDFKILFSGSGSYKKEMDALSGRLGLGDKICYSGFVSSWQLPELYSCADVLVLPSRTKRNWKEQFGRVLIEAMACEIPVIGSSSGEIPAVIGNTGLTFREDSPSALAAELIRVIDMTEDQRREMGLKGRMRVLENYTQRIIAQETFEFYRKLLGR